MQFPIDIHYGQFTLKSHLILEILAYSIGYRYYSYLKRTQSDSIDEKDRLWIIIGAAIGALIFSRLVGILENPIMLAKYKFNILYYFGNKTVVGGLVGGLLGVEITKKIIGVKVSSGDLMTYPIILAMIIGRIGCFMEGLEDGTYGIATSLPFGINFGDGIYRHPTNLYEIIFLILTWISLFLIEKRITLANGMKFKIFLISYLVFRFLVEFIKPEFRFSFGLGVIQITCLVGLLYYLILTIYNNFKR